jgi:hypothetical protein
MAIIWDFGLVAKMARYRSLLNSDNGKAGASHVVTELADLKRDLLGSGLSEAELIERSAAGVSGQS